MTIVLIGRVKSVGADSADIEDIETGLLDTFFIERGCREEIKEGVTGLFLGYKSGKVFVVRKVNVRKILDPLYEEDLLRASAVLPIIPVVGNPFERIAASISGGG